jgi:hypothetical protein
MPDDTITLDIYVAVNENGQYGVATTDFDDARSDLENVSDDPTAIRYKIAFVIPNPASLTHEVRIEAKLNQPRSIPEAFGNIAEVKVYDDD